jgi:hypothetical protein
VNRYIYIYKRAARVLLGPLRRLTHVFHHAHAPRYKIKKSNTANSKIVNVGFNVGFFPPQACFFRDECCHAIVFFVSIYTSPRTGGGGNCHSQHTIAVYCSVSNYCSFLFCLFDNADSLFDCSLSCRLGTPTRSFGFPAWYTVQKRLLHLVVSSYNHHERQEKHGQIEGRFQSKHTYV